MDDGFLADAASIAPLADVVDAVVADLAGSSRSLAQLRPDAGASTDETDEGLRHLGEQTGAIALYLQGLASALRATASSYTAVDSGTVRAFPGGQVTGRTRP